MDKNKHFYDAVTFFEKHPYEIHDSKYRFESFRTGQTLLGKQKGFFPAMGWNSWNAFGTNNTEILTRAMVDCLLDLGLSQLGYQFVVLDDGCYHPVRENGKLIADKNRFPSGFQVISDYVHSKGLKFGMYNDIGPKLCSGSEVGTYGHETEDTESYKEWKIDYIKVDNCYYLWDDATFSDRTNAKYVYAPNINKLQIKENETGTNEEHFVLELSAIKDGVLFGDGLRICDDYVTNIGTFDGTGPNRSPIGLQSGELRFYVTVPKSGTYLLSVSYATGEEAGIGSWLQIAVGEGQNTDVVFDRQLNPTESTTSFVFSHDIPITLEAGPNLIRLMNHRRQENTLCSYAAFLDALNRTNPGHSIRFSICEWGKTQPQNWGYKVGDSWRILNDITFAVGSDGSNGTGTWVDDYTTSITSQYNKAVIMDDFSGLDKGYNDPDMLMIGMDGLTEIMMKTHMTMWCMMNAPLMLGLDLRRVKKGDSLWQIIANESLIALNQDTLGIQAKRLFTSYQSDAPDKDYIRCIQRVDILVKPLFDGSVAISFINIDLERTDKCYHIDVTTIVNKLRSKMINPDDFLASPRYLVRDLWDNTVVENKTGVFEVNCLDACDNKTIRVTPIFHLTTEDFVRTLMRTSNDFSVNDDIITKGIVNGWLEEQDHCNRNHTINRQTAARILHNYLLIVRHEQDETDVSSAKSLLDLYDCHACVNHVAQVYVKGLMQAIEPDTVFGMQHPVTLTDARKIKASISKSNEYFS